MRFSLKRLLAGVTLLSFGLVFLMLSYRTFKQMEKPADILPVAVEYIVGGTLALSGEGCALGGNVKVVSLIALVGTTAIAGIVTWSTYALWIHR
jgi:hypothetical protein